MRLLYDSENFAVLQFEIPTLLDPSIQLQLTRGGFEIMDKSTHKEAYLDGAMAEKFKNDVNAMIEQTPAPTNEDIDAYLSGYASLAQHPLRIH
jgi:hypothetical protein